MSADQHRAEALASLGYWANAEDPGTSISYASEAIAQALLAVDARLGQLVAATELGLVINATVTGVGVPSPASRVTAEAWIRDRIVEIVSRT